MAKVKKIFLFIIAIAISFPLCLCAAPVEGAEILSLNGDWQMGFSRNYSRTVNVPGLATDPTLIVDEVLWYKKEVKLPAGSWISATIELKGARFQPQVYINGELAGKQNGSMGPPFFEHKNENVKPQNTITIEDFVITINYYSYVDK